jgi:hypothetical protein
MDCCCEGDEGGGGKRTFTHLHTIIVRAAPTSCLGAAGRNAKGLICRVNRVFVISAWNQGDG